MRLVQILIPEGRRGAALDVLDDEGIDYAVFDETGRGEYEPTDLLLGNPAEVNVLVGRPANYEPPSNLAERLDRRLTRTTGRAVVVRVGFVTEQRSGEVDMITNSNLLHTGPVIGTAQLHQPARSCYRSVARSEDRTGLGVDRQSPATRSCSEKMR